MKLRLSEIFLWLAKILAGIAVALFIVGEISYLVTAPNFWQALKKIQHELDPYNIPSFLARLLLFIPAGFAYAIHLIFKKAQEK
jgi:uncharacterized membrane protein YkgB